MGDCRIKIVIAKILIANTEKTTTTTTTTTPTSTLSSSSNDFDTPISSTETTISFAAVFSSDTTIREVLEGNKRVWKLINTTPKSSSTSRLWDCTVHPPVDISTWPRNDFPDLQGPKSKTLHSAGWFPSGTILVIPYGMKPYQYSDLQGDEDGQYNRTTTSTTSTAAASGLVSFKDPSLQDQSGNNAKPMPSQVMASVTNRFANDSSMTSIENPELQARLVRQRHRRELRRKERDRAAKLEARIARLEKQQQQQVSSQTKNKKVSEQVLKMLVKSRATGDKNLKLMDRMYFQCIVLNDTPDDADHDDNTTIKEYRYFSPQDTFAKIAATFVQANSNNKKMHLEVLCRRKLRPRHDETEFEQRVHRRFPMNMRVYEAVADGYLEDPSRQEVETLIVRIFDDNNEPTPSVLEDPNDDDGDDTMDIVVTADDVTKEQTSDSQSQTCSTTFDDGTNPQIWSEEFEDPALADVLEKWNETQGKSNTRKSSAAVMKVQQMKMKSKSKGDTKRIPNMEDRFFLEAVMVMEKGPVASGYYFLANSDPIERILQYCATTGNDERENWDFIIPSVNNRCFRRLRTTSTTTQAAQDQGMLQSYGRLILKQKTSIGRSLG
ncbi:hypothetical protein IV203_036001 [Nitzschia inconspicua]|uniref:Uncharacterized protein n=1 Tax=Nitzschia inconspicua TaxID=303405 RepID=A0A9K3LF63_9STRA|nr:hypothetical protein IV203_036001 [Nitzschia inconspicua]